jgi:hypothetical protein
MLQIPADRRPHNPMLLCALMAVTVLLFSTMALHTGGSGAQPGAAQVQQD